MKIITMNRMLFLGSIALAFAAGATSSRLSPRAQAATEMTPMVIHIPDLTGDKLGLPSGTGLRSRGLVIQDGMTLSVQAGPVGKHLHVNANEIQYYLEGTGTIWLGDKEVRVGPGDLVIIPKGTAHGGTKPDSGAFKAIAIKTPPQAPDDVKPLD
ncbi:MAG TPA: cupin domain-containing protein [Xanthobacteraceae bacterium]|nr:cupin domain-containing protein [Xanthobacteraceae bacterium]